MTMNQQAKIAAPRSSGFMIQDTAIFLSKHEATELELVALHQVANPVDTREGLRVASALCARLTPTGNDISPYGLKYIEHWLRTFNGLLLGPFLACESKRAEERDNQWRQQIIKRWTQRVADAYRAAYGDFNRIGEVMINISNEKFPAAIKDFLRYPSQEHNEDHNLEKRRGLSPATRASSTPLGDILRFHS